MPKSWSLSDLKGISIVSDGTMVGTKIYDSEGNPLPRVQEITIKISVDDPVPRAELVVYLPKVNMQGIEVTSIEAPVEPVYEIGSGGEPVEMMRVPRASKKSE